MSDNQTIGSEPMLTANSGKTSVAPTFPTSEIESRIWEFLAEEVAVQTVLATKGASGAGKSGGFGPEPTLDSLVMVEMLVELEEQVPFMLPESLIRPGGYESVDEMVNDLMPRLKDLWSIHHGEKSE